MLGCRVKTWEAFGTKARVSPYKLPQGFHCLGNAHKQGGLVTFAMVPLFLHTQCVGTS